MLVETHISGPDTLTTISEKEWVTRPGRHHHHQLRLQDSKSAEVIDEKMRLICSSY